MTYLQPNQRKSILNLVIAGLALASLAGIFSLVALYNNIVDLNHSIAAAKTELDSVGAKNTVLNNQVIGALHGLQSGSLAAQYGLVENNHPRYFPLTQPSPHQQWPIASQR